MVSVVRTVRNALECRELPELQGSMVTVDGEEEVGELEVSPEDLRRERLRAGLLRRLGGFVPCPNACISSIRKDEVGAQRESAFASALLTR